MNRKMAPQGAELCDVGVHYRIWAPKAERVDVLIVDADSRPIREVPLSKDPDGYFQGLDDGGRSGDLYKYRLNGTESYPDPASRYQPYGVHGPSMVIAPHTYHWNDNNWRRPNFRDLVIYELHVGTFTPEGTYRSTIDKLKHVRDLGATAIELMPLADFAGERNWGYDGVSLYAPAHTYGHPDDLRALVDAAHGMGLAVILDVVYNHFGPDGNYLACYIGDYLDESEKTPWGGAIRYGFPEFQPLKAFVSANPAYWMREFHIDGFRLDATHAIIDHSPRHILKELTATIHAHGGFAIAEDPRNEASLLLPEENGGYGFDGVWADDLHHVVRVANTHESEAYLADFQGTLTELVDTLRYGWLYRGQVSRVQGKKRGTDPSHIPPQGFIHCISNHDQTGNRAFGERLRHTISREAYLASSALICLTPYTPMLFMGKEWSASAPFLFFTDHTEELGKLITEGRREEFKDFEAFQNPETRARIPDPQSDQTFESSKLDWEELSLQRKQQTLALYRECLALRNSEPAFRPTSRESWEVTSLGDGVGAIRLRSEGAEWLVLFDITGGHEASLKDEPICSPTPRGAWSVVLSTNEQRFGGNGESAVDLQNMKARFAAPALVVMRS